MKKISILFVLFLLSTSIFGQSEKLNELFDHYQDTEGVTSIKIAKPMFKLLNNLKIDDEELGKIQPLLGKVNGLKMLILEKPETSTDLDSIDQKSLLQSGKIEKEIAASLKNMKYEELITVNSRDNKIKFLAQDITANVLDNLILNITSEESSVLMLLDGKISMEDVSNLMAESQNVTSVNPVSTITSNNVNLGSVRTVPAFNGIEASSGIEVEFSQNPTQSVTVKTEADKQQYVMTEVENGVLKIFVRNKGIKNLNFKDLKVIVSNPKLSRLTTKSGASFRTVSPVNEATLALSCNSGSLTSGTFKISGNTVLEVGSGSSAKINLETKSIAIDASSGSSLNLSGSANSCVISANNGSSVSARGFITKSAVVNASSGSSVMINTTESVTANASSAASIQYKGNPAKVTKSAQEATGASITSIN